MDGALHLTRPARARRSPVAATPKAPNRRQLAKARTRERVLEAARTLFSKRSYADANIRIIASTAGISTGAVFANFADKADLWRAAMGCEPPMDSPVVRTAHEMLSALRCLVAVRPENWDDDEAPDQVAAWTAAEAAIAKAEGREAGA